MLKSPSSSTTSPSSSTNTISNIFQTMAYNEHQAENFSSILAWIGSKEDTLNCVLNGTQQQSLHGGKEGGVNFPIGQKVVNVTCLDAKRLESILGQEKRVSPQSPPSSWDEKERLAKFEGLMKTLTADLCTAESIAHQVPLPQVLNFDAPTWNLKEIMTLHHSSPSLRSAVQTQSKTEGAVRIVWKLQRSSYNLRDLLSLLAPAVLSGSSRISLILSLASSDDSPCVLPPAFLIDALNKAGIPNNPIDLLITKEPQAILDIALRKFGHILWCGDVDDTCNLSAGIRTGAFKQITKAVHFILDSSADVGSAVESIAAETWTSGSRVRTRARSLLFVHQPAYVKTVQCLTQKITSFKTSADVTHKSVDFITRTEKVQDKLLAQVFPPEGDFSGPTLLSEIGTSNALIALPRPGTGHLLCVIPYRSLSELQSLTSSLGDDAVTSIYSSNCDTLKKLLLNLRGPEIRVNSVSQQPPSLTNINNWAHLYSPEDSTPPPPSISTSLPKDEFLSGAEKAMKAWSSVGVVDRLALAQRVLLSTTNNDHSFLIDLMRLSLPQPENLETFTIPRTKPIGIVAIVIVHPNLMSTLSVLSPILSATSTGNATIVISVDGHIQPAIVDACQSIFPTGLVNFTNRSSVTDSFKTLITSGKVSHALIYSSDQQQLNEIPVKDFPSIALVNSTQPAPPAFTIPKLIHW